MAPSLKDFLPQHHPELLLSFDEYVNTWGELIEVGYGNTMADEEVFPSLGLGEDGTMRLSVEAALVLCSDAMRTFRRGRRVPKKVSAQLEEAVVYDAGMRITEDEGAAREFLSVYRAHAQIFGQLLPDSGKPDQETDRRELVGAARYAASRCSERAEDENVAGIQKIAVHFARTHELFAKLDANSIPDSNTMLFGKPRFIVREDI